MTATPETPRARTFALVRDTDVSGVSGTGKVAEGVEFSDGSVVLRWLTEWPTSVVFHDRGIDAVRQVHGHGGATRIVFHADWCEDCQEHHEHGRYAPGPKS